MKGRFGYHIEQGTLVEWSQVIPLEDDRVERSCLRWLALIRAPGIQEEYDA
ncbi:MAG: hypothetical protein ABSE51_07835 [Terracidiphilus sp.]|jgi:hypothetical protein